MSNMWGFDLDMTAVRLMRRNMGEWQEVAAEKIEGADIEERLMALAARIEEDAPVHIFMPSDQILYTEVALHSDGDARAQVASALEEIQPYPIDELDFDWDISTPGTARIAAIALETLDEAVAFAEVRGIKIGGFSSFAKPDDFPRNPEFVSHNILHLETEEEVAGPPVAFASGRVQSKPRPDAGTLAPVSAEANPIIKVDDDAPVMRIKAPVSLPLDPGTAISSPQKTPRVRTDIAAAVMSEQVASLSPPSVKVHNTKPAFWKIGAVFALVLLMTVGIATLVWQLLPLGPGSTSIPVSEDTGAGVETPSEPDENIEIAAPEADPAIVADPAEIATELEPAAEQEPEIAVVDGPVVPDLPQPVIFDVPDVTSVPLPDEEAAGEVARLTAVTRAAPGIQFVANRSSSTLPFVDLGLPSEPAPEALTRTLTIAPDLDVAQSGIDDWVDDIYIASLDDNDLAFDAIALPSATAFVPQGLPLAEAAPLAPAEITAEAEPAVDAPIEQVDQGGEPDIPAVDVPLAEEVARLDNEVTTPEAPLAQPETAPTEVETADAQAEPPAQTIIGLPRPTELAANLTDRAPAARPETFVTDIERQRFGGRTRTELGILRPPARPESAQIVAMAARAQSSEVSELAVSSSLSPRGRPRDFDAIVAVAIVQRQAARVTASLDYQTPNTNAAIEAALSDDAEPAPRPAQTQPRATQSAPRVSIPSSASVARQATIEDAIRLNRVNLVGVYGSSSDRRALVRLPSGRFVKVKVGDRFDGGTVERITDEELIYLKGRKTVLLSLPKG